MYHLEYYILDENSPRFIHLQSAFTNPMTVVYLFFYEAVLQTFNSFNKFLQREDPLVLVMSDQMNAFLTKLASKFLPVSSIKAARQDFYELQYSNVSDQLPGIK